MAADRVEIERNVQRVLRRQHYLITAAQAQRAGLTRPALARRVNAGRLDVFTRGLYRDATHAITHHQRALAPILIHPSWSAAACETAAWLYAVDGVRPRTQVDIAVEATASHTNRLARVHPVFGLKKGDVRRVDGIPCLSPELTLLQIAARRDFDAVELIFIDMACKGILTTESVLAMLARFAMSGRNGVVVLRQVAERWDGKRLPGSPPELKLGRILESYGYEIEYQRAIEERNGKERFADLAIAGYPVVVEFQSEKHHAVRKAMRADSTRALRMTAAGVHVLPASQADIDNLGVDVVAAIEAIIRGRAA